MKKIATLLTTFLAALFVNAAVVNVNPSTLSGAYSEAADGDVLVLDEGAYGGQLTFPDKKTVTFRAAEGADVTFACLFRANDETLSGGGIILEGLKISITDSYFINLDKYGDIKRIEVRNCEISNIARCFLRTNNDQNTIDDITFDKCIIHDCGSGGWNFMYPKHIVKKLSVTRSTLYNYQNGESLFFANGKNQSNVFTFVFSSNTVYRWAKSNDRAFCKTESKYSPESVYTFTDNIVYKGGADNVTPQMIQATGGTLTAKNNLVVDYGDYNFSGTKDIADLTLSGLGMTELSFPNPSAGDFTIVSTSPLATASTTGGIIGDPRWLKTVTQAVSVTAAPSPAEGGSVTPTNAIFETGDKVTLSATANYGYRFKEWQDTDGNVISTDNPYTFNISSNLQAVGVFAAVDTYTLKINKEGDGGKWGNVRLLPEPVNGVYETGTEVTVSIAPNSVTSFLYWENGTSEQNRSITMDGNKEMTATFDVVPFIVAWDFAESEPRGSRPADYAYATDNNGLLNIYNGDGSTTNWGGSNRNFGGKQLNCIRRYTNYSDMKNPRSFVARFSVEGYTNIRIHSLAGADNGCVHSVQKMQYSADGENYKDLATLNMTQNEWLDFDAQLPEGLSTVYIRWIGDSSSELLGSCKDTDTEGFYLADIVCYADKQAANDTEAPQLLSSSPAAGSASASARGNFVLTFNERVKAGSGDITLNGSTLTSIYGSKTVTLAYKGLAYGNTYTLHIPAGAITDISGNAYAGADIQFTTMQRPVPEKRVFDAVVANDGTGDYTTVQDAINAAPSNRISPWIIFVKNGEYEELVKIPSSKPFIHLIGQDKEKTIIKYWINNGGSSDIGYEYSTNNPASKTYGYQGVFQCDATDFYTENITYYNSFGVEKQSGPMGLAMRSTNDRQAFYNCKFRSFQDTWFTTTTNVSDRHYISNCWIEGAVDYFYGAGEVYVENTTFYNARSTGSVVVAPCHKAGTKFGYVFDRCTLDGKGSRHSLGRAWQNEPIAVWLNTTFKTEFSPEGWSEWHIAPKLFAEYNSTDANGNPIDLNNRRTEYKVDGQSEKAKRQAILTDEEAAKYTHEAVTGGTDDWNPRRLMEAVNAPAGLAYSAADRTLTWQPSAYAICYIVIDQNDHVAGITAETSFATDGSSQTYTVKAVNEYGSLSQAATVSTATGIASPDAEPVACEYYNLQGIRLNAPARGMNIVSMRMTDGKTINKIICIK